MLQNRYLFLYFCDEETNQYNIFKTLNIKHMNLEITGKVVGTGQRQTGEGRNGAWVKQELIIETEDQYPKKVCLHCWGERADEAKAFTPGEKIKAGINIESREFNGKWYTDVKAWKLDRIGTEPAAPMASDEPPYPQDYDAGSSMEDDLPF
jgi:hypothetical protein